MTTNPDSSFELKRIDERLAGISWPKLKKVNVPVLGNNDCFLVCAGFEDRSIDPLHRICCAASNQFTVGLIRYLPDLAQNRTSELRETAYKADLNIVEFVYDRANPAGTGEEIRDFSLNFDHVYIDISGMSRLLIVQLIVALLQKRTRSTSVIYCEANEYPPSVEEYKRDTQTRQDLSTSSFLSSGVIEIAVTPELSSVSMLGQSIRLVSFPSFDPTQLSNLIQELQPTYAEFLHGTPPYRKYQWRTQAIRDLNGRTLEQLQGKKEHYVSTLDYRETLKLLLDIYSQRSMFSRIVIAPTGSKMQSVAVGIFRAALSDVQIVYPTPQTFVAPERYTIGVRQLNQMDLPIEAIRSLFEYI